MLTSRAAAVGSATGDKRPGGDTRGRYRAATLRTLACWMFYFGSVCQSGKRTIGRSPARSGRAALGASACGINQVAPPRDAQVRGRSAHSLMRARFLRKHFARLPPEVEGISQDFLRRVDLSQKFRVSSRAGGFGAADRFESGGGAKRRCGRRPAARRPSR